MRAAVLALLVTTACTTTIRARTTPAGVLEEEGTCDSEDVGPHEECHEESKFDESRTVLLVAGTVALVVAAIAGASYFDPR